MGVSIADISISQKFQYLKNKNKVRFTNLTLFFMINKQYCRAGLNALQCCLLSWVLAVHNIQFASKSCLLFYCSFHVLHLDGVSSFHSVSLTKIRCRHLIWKKEIKNLKNSQNTSHVPNSNLGDKLYA